MRGGEADLCGAKARVFTYTATDPYAAKPAPGMIARSQQNGLPPRKLLECHRGAVDSSITRRRGPNDNRDEQSAR